MENKRRVIDDPDLLLMNEYIYMSQGRDQQLETAVAALMKEIISNRS